MHNRRRRSNCKRCLNKGSNNWSWNDGKSRSDSSRNLRFETGVLEICFDFEVGGQNFEVGPPETSKPRNFEVWGPNFEVSRFNFEVSRFNFEV